MDVGSVSIRQNQDQQPQRPIRAVVITRQVTNEFGVYQRETIFTIINETTRLDAAIVNIIEQFLQAQAVVRRPGQLGTEERQLTANLSTNARVHAAASRIFGFPSS